VLETRGDDELMRIGKEAIVGYCSSVIMIDEINRALLGLGLKG
jgi:hypothetical protein